MNDELNLFDSRIGELLFRRAVGALTDDERRELDEWCGDDAARRELCSRMDDAGHLEDELLRRRAIAAGTGRPLADMQRRTGRKGGFLALHGAKRQLVIASAAAALFIA